MTYNVAILEEEMNEVRNLHYLYKSLISTLSIIGAPASSVEDEIVQNNLTQTMTVCIELRKKKDFLSLKYRPDNIDKYNYSFNFLSNTICYEVIK